MQLLSMFLRVILGLILLAAAIGKLFSMEAFKLALDQYRLPRIRILKYFIVAVELVAGIGLLTGKAVVISSLISLLLFITILVQYTVLYGRKLKHGCGCFGGAKAMVINKFEIGKVVSLILLSTAVFTIHLTHCL